MFITALVTITKLRNYPRCPPTDEWLKNMWFIFTMEYYSPIKKNEIMSFARKLIELGITLSRVSQAQKTSITCLLSYVESRPKQ
jgi:hypothetical protein